MLALVSSGLTSSCRLQEWARAPAVLSTVTIASLQRCQPCVVDVRLHVEGSCELTASHFVGRGNFAGFDLRIVPKIPMSSVLALIDDDHHLLRFGPSSELGDAFELEELLARALVGAVSRICRRGLKRDYVGRDEELAFARGRVDLRRTGLLHAIGRPRLACSFEDFEQDCAENRAIAFAVRRLTSFTTLFSERVRRDAGELAAVLPAPAAFSADDIDRLAGRARDGFYRAALRLAALIVRALGLSDQHDGYQGPGFWIDMHKLFEAFVQRTIERGLAGDECTIAAQATRFLDRECRVQLNPDLIVRRGAQEMPVDAKYKASADPHSDDVYQLLAYCRALRSECGVIVMAHARLPRPIYCVSGEVIWTVGLSLESPRAIGVSAARLATFVSSLATQARTTGG